MRERKKIFKILLQILHRLNNLVYFSTGDTSLHDLYITTLILTILIINLQCAPYKWTMHVRMKHPGSHLCLHAFICDSFSREPCSISDHTYNIAFNIDICALWPEFLNFVEKSWGIFLSKFARIWLKYIITKTKYQLQN